MIASFAKGWGFRKLTALVVEATIGGPTCDFFFLSLQLFPLYVWLLLPLNDLSSYPHIALRTLSNNLINVTLSQKEHL